MRQTHSLRWVLLLPLVFLPPAWAETPAPPAPSYDTTLGDILFGDGDAKDVQRAREEGDRVNRERAAAAEAAAPARRADCPECQPLADVANEKDRRTRQLSAQLAEKKNTVEWLSRETENIENEVKRRERKISRMRNQDPRPEQAISEQSRALEGYRSRAQRMRDGLVTVKAEIDQVTSELNAAIQQGSDAHRALIACERERCKKGKEAGRVGALGGTPATGAGTGACAFQPVMPVILGPRDRFGEKSIGQKVEDKAKGFFGGLLSQSTGGMVRLGGAGAAAGPDRVEDPVKDKQVFTAPGGATAIEVGAVPDPKGGVRLSVNVKDSASKGVVHTVHRETLPPPAPESGTSLGDILFGDGDAKDVDRVSEEGYRRDLERSAARDRAAAPARRAACPECQPLADTVNEKDRRTRQLRAQLAESKRAQDMAHQEAERVDREIKRRERKISRMRNQDPRPEQHIFDETNALQGYQSQAERVKERLKTAKAKTDQLTRDLDAALQEGSEAHRALIDCERERCKTAKETGRVGALGGTPATTAAGAGCKPVVEPPSDYWLYETWADWSISVWWRKDTYVDNQLVKREQGSWFKEGKTMIESGVFDAAKDIPKTAWGQLGFDRAFAGPRSIGATFQPSTAAQERYVIHVSEPQLDPVKTTPIVVYPNYKPDGKIEFHDIPPIKPGGGMQRIDPPATGPGPRESILDSIQ